MPQTGSLVIRVFTSRAQLPVAGATAVVARSTPDGQQQVISIQQTNESGLTKNITLDTPDQDLSKNPGNPLPFASYDLVVEHPDYYLALYDNLQVFSGVETVQNVPLTPLPQPAGSGENTAITVRVTPQSL